MTRQELTDAVAQLLGIHATEERVGTIILLADAYAQDAYAAAERDLARKQEASSG